jgi:hypothetical protein
MTSPWRILLILGILISVGLRSVVFASDAEEECDNPDGEKVRLVTRDDLAT